MDLPPNDDGNKNITSFSEAINKDLSEDERNLTEDMVRGLYEQGKSRA